MQTFEQGSFICLLLEGKTVLICISSVYLGVCLQSSFKTELQLFQHKIRNKYRFICGWLKLLVNIFFLEFLQQRSST